MFVTIASALIAAALTGVLVVVLRPRPANKAGPTWLWALGEADPFRNMLFRKDGSLRKFSRIAVCILVVPALVFALLLFFSSLAKLITGSV